MGDAAGFLNVPRIKGIHTAMKSAMLAAEAVLAVLEESGTVVECAKEASTYTALFQQSWLYQELHAARNIRHRLNGGCGQRLLIRAWSNMC